MPDRYDIIVYGTSWCVDCHRTRRFLDNNAVRYQWVNIDRNRDAEQVVLKMNHGMRSVPTIVFADGSTLVEPTNAQISEKLKSLMRS